MPRWVIALLLVIPFSGNPVAAYDQGAAEKLFQKQCSVCHHVDRALKKTKDRAGWEKTVIRMKGYASGLIGDAEAETIIEYLTQIRGPKS